MVHKVGVATVLGGACVLAGLFHWSNLALTPRLQVKRCSTKSPREVEGLSLAKLEGLAQDLERRYIQTGKLKGGVLAVVRAGKVVGIWEFGEYNSETVFKFFSISKVFTAIAGLQLCEEKGVSLETPAGVSAQKRTERRVKILRSAPWCLSGRPICMTSQASWIE
ncbi:unnamed protein product [Durusdinium trenchii]|uniref:Beta-lactamase-related domain-containing protein n=1 Tax=Durusdinium trenchii TaxID=1381693 RepID=A0ABP0T0L6_9DINO